MPTRPASPALPPLRPIPSCRRRAGRAGGRVRALLIVLPVALLVALGGGAGLAFAAGAETGLKLPRFVSLGSSEVNLRTGPGGTYPIEWVYLRRHMPVEVIAEFGHWRKVRDWQGSVGWVHQNLLDGRRYVLITGSERLLRARPAADAPPVARLMPRVVARLLACAGAWCRIEVAGHGGWLPQEAFWGAYPNERFGD